MKRITHAVYVVTSVWHGNGRDRTFLHGVFQDILQAEEVALHVKNNLEYVAAEGYALHQTTAHSTYIATIPMNTHVNDFVPTDI